MAKIKLFKTDIFGFKKKEVEKYISRLEASHRLETEELRGALAEAMQNNKALAAENKALGGEAAALRDELSAAGRAKAAAAALLESARGDCEQLQYDYDTLKYVYDGISRRYAVLQSESETVRNAIFRLPFVQQYILQLKEEIESLRINQSGSGNDFTDGDADRTAELNRCIEDIAGRIDALLAKT